MVFKPPTAATMHAGLESHLDVDHNWHGNPHPSRSAELEMSRMTGNPESLLSNLERSRMMDSSSYERSPNFGPARVKELKYSVDILNHQNRATPKRQTGSRAEIIHHEDFRHSRRRGPSASFSHHSYSAELGHKRDISIGASPPRKRQYPNDKRRQTIENYQDPTLYNSSNDMIQNYDSLSPQSQPTPTNPYGVQPEPFRNARPRANSDISGMYSAGRRSSGRASSVGNNSFDLVSSTPKTIMESRADVPPPPPADQLPPHAGETRDIFTPPTVDNFKRGPDTGYEDNSIYEDSYKKRIMPPYEEPLTGGTNDDMDDVELHMESENQTRDRPNPHLPPKTDEQRRLEQLYFADTVTGLNQTDNRNQDKVYDPDFGDEGGATMQWQDDHHGTSGGSVTGGSATEQSKMSTSVVTTNTALWDDQDLYDHRSSVADEDEETAAHHTRVASLFQGSNIDEMDASKTQFEALKDEHIAPSEHEPLNNSTKEATKKRPSVVKDMTAKFNAEGLFRKRPLEAEIDYV